MKVEIIGGSVFYSFFSHANFHAVFRGKTRRKTRKKTVVALFSNHKKINYKSSRAFSSSAPLFCALLLPFNSSAKSSFKFRPRDNLALNFFMNIRIGKIAAIIITPLIAL